MRFRVAVVAFWLLAAVAAALLLPNVEQAQTGTLGDLVPSDADAIDTEVRSVELFDFPVLSRTVAVERDREGLAPARVADVYVRATAIGLGKLVGLESIAFALPVTDNLLDDDPEGTAHSALTYLFYRPDLGPVGRTGLARLLVDQRIDGPDVQTGVTGAVPARGDQITAITDALPLVELLTVILITLAVGLHFRSLVAPARQHLHGRLWPTWSPCA